VSLAKLIPVVLVIVLLHQHQVVLMALRTVMKLVLIVVVRVQQLPRAASFVLRAMIAIHSGM